MSRTYDKCLYLACQNDTIEHIDDLIERGASFNQQLIHLAVCNYNFDLAMDLQKAGSPLPDEYNMNTILTKAMNDVSAGRYDIIEFAVRLIPHNIILEKLAIMDLPEPNVCHVLDLINPSDKEVIKKASIAFTKRGYLKSVEIISKYKNFEFTDDHLMAAFESGFEEIISWALGNK